jgi:probable HAF family extracellular repeat protein
MTRPFPWDGAKLIVLMAPAFGASLTGEARWINEAGEVVGGARLTVPCDNQGFQTHGFLWRNGAMTDLGMIPGCAHRHFGHAGPPVAGAFTAVL